MNSIKYTFCALLVIICFSCDKTPEGEKPDPPFILNLATENDTIWAGESTKIMATVTGESYILEWEVVKGTLLPGETPTEIIYTGAKCAIGTNIITCTAKDEYNQKDVKTIAITVI